MGIIRCHKSPVKISIKLPSITVISNHPSTEMDSSLLTAFIVGDIVVYKFLSGMAIFKLDFSFLGPNVATSLIEKCCTSLA